MQTIQIEPIDISTIKDAEKETQLIVQEAQALTIKTQEDYTLAGNIRMKLKGKIKELDNRRKSITVPLDEAKKRIMALFTPLIDFLNKGVNNLDSGMITYTDIQERLAREAQAKAEEQARKERERAEAKAREFEAKGKEEKAQQWQEKAESVIAPVISADIPKVAGQGIKTLWYAEVTSFKDLPDEYKLINQSALDKVGQATQGRAIIPGTIFKSRKSVAGRSA